MSNFTKYNDSNAPEASVDTLEQYKRQLGFIPNLVGYTAESPALTKAYKVLGDLLAGGSLDVTEQQVVIMTINRFHDCRYCMAAHTKISEMTGVNMAAINAIRDDKLIGDAKLGALRGFTHALVKQRGKVSAFQLNTLFEAGYTKETALEIIAAAAYKTISNYTNHLVGTDLDGAFIDHKWAPVNER